MSAPTLHQLADLVGRMRDLQRLYFRQRNTITLNECKKAERAVDDALAELRGERQLKLFDCSVTDDGEGGAA